MITLTAANMNNVSFSGFSLIKKKLEPSTFFQGLSKIIGSQEYSVKDNDITVTIAKDRITVRFDNQPPGAWTEQSVIYKNGYAQATEQVNYESVPRTLNGNQCQPYLQQALLLLTDKDRKGQYKQLPKELRDYIESYKIKS